MNPQSAIRNLDASRPGAYGRVAAAVREKNSERVRGPRLGLNGNENPAASNERFEDAAVMRLEADTAHGAGDADLAEIPRAPLQRLNEWSARDDAADAADVEPIAFRAERLLDERRGLGTLFRDDAQHVDRESRVLQR